MKREPWISSLLLVVGLLFAILGQFYFAYRREYVWDGVLFWGIAIYSFGLLLWRMARQQRGHSVRARSVRAHSVRAQSVRAHSVRAHSVRKSLHWLSTNGARVAWAVGGALLALLAGWIARQPERVDFGLPFWMWLIGVCCFLISFAWPISIKEWRQRLLDWFRSHRREAAGLAALLLLALLVRAINLEHIPANLGGDEGTQGVSALDLLGPPLRNPFSTGWYSVPTMSFLAYGASMRVFGASVAGLRTISALTGTITVLTTFLLARELWGRRVAWLASIALACAHFHIHFSRLGSNQIFDGLFMTLSLWLLVRALGSRQKIYFALAGAVMGLGWYVYFGARLVGIIAACYLAWRLIVEHRFLHRYGRLLMISLIAALLVMAPLLLHYGSHPQELLSRTRQVSIFSSGWLEREQAITGRSAASLVLQQFWKAISAFNYTLDPTFWYRASIPTLDFISGVLFILGLIWTMGRCRWPNNGLLLIWFWLALGFGWVMTENPPSSQRMIVLAPALALLVGLGLNWLTELYRRVLGLVDGTAIGSADDRRLQTVLAGALLFAVLFLNLQYYFFVYTPTRIYGNPTAEIATELGHHLQQQEDDSVIYFYGPPFMYWGFGTLNFMAQGVEGVDVPPSDGNDLPGWNLDRGARFIFLKERVEELDAVRAQYPGGEETFVYSGVDDRLLYVLYKVEK